MPWEDNLLLHNDGNDQEDILSEFLDQRVFDSYNHNTPRFDENDTKSIPRDFDPSYLQTGAPEMTNNNGGVFDIPTSNADIHSFTASPDTANSSLRPSAFDSLGEYELIRKEMAAVKFGNPNMKTCPDSLDVKDPSYLDFSPATMSSLPYSLKILDLPSQSRVETQIKFAFQFSPPPKEPLLHLPQDLISKNKLCLQDPVSSLSPELKKNMLFVDTYVLTSDLSKSCDICKRCIKREQKRASRSKNPSTDHQPPASSVKTNPNTWADEDMVKKAIIFNCKEIVSFPAPTGLESQSARSVDLFARIVCYCRHHKEHDGFRLLVVVKDCNDKVVAKSLSGTIMIMDRKKNLSVATSTYNDTSLFARKDAGKSSNEDNNVKMEDHLADHLGSVQPLSPYSIDDSTSDVLANTDTNTDSFMMSLTRGAKRKKMSFDDSYNPQGNPMLNGGSSGLSPLSNSDTNTSIHNMNPKASATPQNMPGFTASTFAPHLNQPSSISRQRLQQSLSMLAQAPTHPTIQKVIPAQGPIRGGIEVTLLGFNFRPGLNVKFGSKNSLATHCWSESTMVTYLPPAAQPGQVLVSFETFEHVIPPNQHSVFTYTDDTDRQLIELALQIVGLKMNGKLEDAKNIAKRIVGSDGTTGGGNSSNENTPGTQGQAQQLSMNRASMEWYDNAHRAVEKLSKSDLSTEEILINFLSLVDLPNCPIIIPNWQLCNGQGQTLLHLATLKKYTQLIKFLITHGCKIDIRDNQGLTPLFFASMCGHRDLIGIFIECKSNWNLRLSNDKVLKDYCDLNVLDIFNKLEAELDASDDSSTGVTSSKELNEDVLLSKSHSADSLNSLFMMDYGKHISKMVIESTEPRTETDGGNSEDPASSRVRCVDGYGSDSSDFADSELESDEGFSDDGQDAGWGIERGHNDDEDYEDDYDDESDMSSSDQDDDRAGGNPTKKISGHNLWQKMKNAVFSNDSDGELPSYNDLFPFGPSSLTTPKTQAEMQLNESTTTGRSTREHEDGVSSDSSEDMVISYINHPRKTVENDKMLIFFWIPVLVFILGLFLYVSITGYKVEFIEQCKEVGRNALGSVIVGNERLKRVFTNVKNEPMASF